MVKVLITVETTVIVFVLPLFLLVRIPSPPPPQRTKMLYILFIKRNVIHFLLPINLPSAKMCITRKMDLVRLQDCDF